MKIERRAFWNANHSVNPVVERITEVGWVVLILTAFHFFAWVWNATHPEEVFR